MKQDHDINVALCFDVNYMNYMLITALSLLENLGDDRKVHFHLLHDCLSDDLIKIIETRLSQDNTKLFFYSASNLDLPSIKNVGRYGMAALYRLVLDKVLPDELNKVIYLDCDLLVLDDLGILWDIDLESNLVAAVVNLSDKPSKGISEKLILPSEYFNSGVLVINLDLWRSERISIYMIDRLISGISGFKFKDQDLLNIALHKRWLKLPVKWNMESDIFAYRNKKKSHPFHESSSIDQALESPGIIHFTGPKKPWHYYSFHPYKRYYKYFVYKYFDGESFLYKDRSLLLFINKIFQVKRNIKEFVNRPKINQS